MISIAPSFLRRTGASKEVLAAQQVSADPMVYQQFPAFFLLSDAATASRCRVELKVAAKMAVVRKRFRAASNASGGNGGRRKRFTAKMPMSQFCVIIDVYHSRFTLLTLDRTVVGSFEFQQLSAADFVPDELALRVVFRNRTTCWSFSYEDPVWSVILHTMSDAQLKYIGALLQGFSGLNRPLNRAQNILCSREFHKIGKETLKIWIGTWNMGGIAVPISCPSRYGISPSLKTWLKLDEIENDMYVMGVQEMHEGFIEAASDLLGNGFLLISSKVMGQIGIAVFLKRRMLPFVTNIETMFEATGFGGIGTNKGFVATSLLFLAHSRPKRLAERMRQLKIAIRHLRLGKLAGVDAIHQFTTFWFGDMNFRVCTTDHGDWPESGRTRQDIVDSLYEADSVLKTLPGILVGDQLNIQKAKGIIFNHFREGEIRFSPTYKYLQFPPNTTWEPVMSSNNSNTVVGFVASEIPETDFSKASAQRDVPDRQLMGYYHSLALKGNQRREFTSEKAQTPSWCDRILYRALPCVQVTQHSYEACDDILTSDHSPVSSTFSVAVPSTTHSFPDASFYTGAIQFLFADIIRFRHPSRTVQSFLEPRETKDSIKRPSLAVGLGRLSTIGLNRLNASTGSRLSFTSFNTKKSPTQTKLSTSVLEQLSVTASSVDSSPGQTSVLKAAAQDSDNSDDEDGGTMEPITTTGEGEELTVKDEFQHFDQLFLGVTYPFVENTSGRYSYVCTKPASALIPTHTWTPEWEEDYNAGTLASVEQDVEYSFRADDLNDLQLAPFMTTREYLSTQWIVIHLLPRQGASISESVASCVVPLGEALATTSSDGVSSLKFECDLQHEGEPSGKIRGALRLTLNSDQGWNYSNRERHPLTGQNLRPASDVERSKSFLAGRKKTMKPILEEPSTVVIKIPV